MLELDQEIAQKLMDICLLLVSSQSKSNRVHGYSSLGVLKLPQLAFNLAFWNQAVFEDFCQIRFAFSFVLLLLFEPSFMLPSTTSPFVFP